MLEKVRVLPRKSLWAIFNLPYNGHTNYFSKNNLILKLDDLYKFNLAMSMFNYINNPTDHRDLISSRLTYNSSYHGYSTRTNNNLSVIRFSCTASQSSFVYQSIKNWFMLPLNLKSTSKTNFKVKLRKTLLLSILKAYFISFFFLFLLFFSHFSPLIPSVLIVFQ